MKWRNRKLIFGMAALAAIGLAGASLAAQGTEQAAQGTEQVAENDQAGVVAQSTSETVESVVEDDDSAVEAETEAEAADSSEDAAESSEAPIVGTDLDRASAVALEFTGSGSVTATEVGDEESYYEVEVTMDDGRQIDVQLDENFNVVGTD
jgi:uncharacterized membrane protein YkoI